MDAKPSDASAGAALRFVLLIGALSFFADFTYEGARSVLGPYLGSLGASAAAVGVVTGFGEFAGYALRLASGRWADSRRVLWPLTILGYAVQMTAVPALALTSSWPAAASLIILERVGKALRNPPRDVMLAHAGESAGGFGWAFGLHEALDQLGALAGPLLVAGVLVWRNGDFHLAFAVLAIPAAINLSLVLAARAVYPAPDRLEAPGAGRADPRDSRFWIYLAGAALVAAGFADYPLITLHSHRSGSLDVQEVAVLYAGAMAVSGAGSLALGRLFDRHGFDVLIALTAVGALYAPLVFLGGFWASAAGVLVWGLGMGVHESIIPAAVAHMVPAGKRGASYGLFTAGYGLAWFAGSAALGFLLDLGTGWATLFCLVCELGALPLFFAVRIARPDRGAAAGKR